MAIHGRLPAPARGDRPCARRTCGRRSAVIGFGGPPSSGFLGPILNDWEERDRSAQDIIGEIQPQFFGVPGVFAFATNPPAFGGFHAAGAVRGAESGLRGAGAGDGYAGGPREHDSGLINVDTDLRVTQAGAGGHARPRSRRRPRRAGARHRDDAADVAGRPRREPVHVGQQAVRRHPAARSRGAVDAVGHHRAAGARAERRARAARRGDARRGAHRSAPAQPPQSRPVVHAVGEHGARASRLARRSIR